MTWVKLDDQFFRNPKAQAAGKEGRQLYVAGLCYCAGQLTDGRIIKPALPLVAAEAGVRPVVARRLVEVGLWVDRVDHYEIHDYLAYNPSAEQVKVEREIAKRRWAMNNNPELRKAIRSRDGDRCRYCGTRVNWRDRKGLKGGTYDHVLPLTQGGDESVDNLVVCCRDCNAKKGPRTPDTSGMALRPPPMDQALDLDGTQTGSSHSPDIPSPSPRDVPGGTSLAKSTLDSYWESVNPKPATRYIGLLKIVEHLLDCGWSTGELDNALRVARTHTTAALEFVLRSERGVSTTRESVGDRNIRLLRGELA